jgi:hypothetical protein
MVGIVMELEHPFEHVGSLARAIPFWLIWRKIRFKSTQKQEFGVVKQFILRIHKQQLFHLRIQLGTNTYI